MLKQIVLAIFLCLVCPYICESAAIHKRNTVRDAMGASTSGFAVQESEPLNFLNRNCSRINELEVQRLWDDLMPVIREKFAATDISALVDLSSKDVASMLEVAMEESALAIVLLRQGLLDITLKHRSVLAWENIFNYCRRKYLLGLMRKEARSMLNRIIPADTPNKTGLLDILVKKFCKTVRSYVPDKFTVHELEDSFDDDVMFISSTYTYVLIDHNVILEAEMSKVTKLITRQLKSLVSPIDNAYSTFILDFIDKEITEAEQLHAERWESFDRRLAVLMNYVFKTFDALVERYQMDSRSLLNETFINDLETQMHSQPHNFEGFYRALAWARLELLTRVRTDFENALDKIYEDFSNRGTELLQSSGAGVRIIKSAFSKVSHIIHQVTDPQTLWEEQYKFDYGPGGVLHSEQPLSPSRRFLSS